MNKCPNLECRADNPANAKFCRKCGTAFTLTNRYKPMMRSAICKVLTRSHNTSTEAFTLDTFRNISFQPVSVVKIRFGNRFVLFLCLSFVVLWFTTITGLTGVILYEIDHWFYEEVFIYYQYIVADYIEDGFINDEIVRIARKSRMGLFDRNKKKVLLSSTYSNIEKFDNQYLLISKGNKKGLYSLTYRKVIIPVMYDSISPFANSVTSATIQNAEHHYDVKGNKLR